MSRKHDHHRSIKLTAENSRDILAIHKMMRLPISLNSFTNYILERHGIPAMKESKLLRDAVAPRKDSTKL